MLGQQNLNQRIGINLKKTLGRNSAVIKITNVEITICNSRINPLENEMTNPQPQQHRFAYKK
jgi:hypothetical protein